MISSGKVYLISGVTDMRKSIDGLSLIVARLWRWVRSVNLGSSFAIALEINWKFCFGTLMAFGFAIAVWKKALSSGHPQKYRECWRIRRSRYSKVCRCAATLSQVGILNRSGIDISRATLANWCVQLGSKVQIIIDVMKNELLQEKLICADETTVQVLRARLS